MKKQKPSENPPKNPANPYAISLTESLDVIARSSCMPYETEKGLFCAVGIVGQIEGHVLSENSQKVTKYDQLLPLLVRLEADPRIDGVLFLLNTLGGDVEAGLAIAEMIASMRTPTVSLVLGGGHSIGIPLAVSARRSLIVPSATMTLHPVRTGGTVITAPQAFDYLIKMQDRILDFIARHSKADREELHSRMMRTDQMANDVGSVLDGESAVRLGLIDTVGGLADAMRELEELKGERAKDVAF